MNHILLLVIISQITFAFASSSGRYNFQKNKIERHRRQHKTENCLYNICEHDPNYPDPDIEKIINKHKSIESYFGGNIIEPSSDISIFTRDDNIPTPFCETNDISVIPKIMEDIHGVTRSIVNTKNHKQVLKFQTCKNEIGKSCYPGKLTNNLSFSTYCVQKFNVIKLVTVNVTTEELEYSKFQIPSTCVCTYELESYF